MNVIRVLPEEVACQIAAGEVIERPASIIKELIDNSIDAKADRIDIRIEDGGKRLVRVKDNGVGMSREDLLLCVQRHATSKVQHAQDLFQIRSLGFRGEALPSMASVSRMEVLSLPRGGLVGHRLRISGGQMEGIEETGMPAGTIVEVKDLFFNLPARRKFLRGTRTEMDRLVDTALRTLLPFPEVGLLLTDGERRVLDLPPTTDPVERLVAVLGRQVAETLVSGVEDRGQLRVKVYGAPGEMARSRADRLYVYVNGRAVRDKLLIRAILDGYGQRLMKGQYPQAAVFVDMAPEQVDVNVHPTKQEVRFQNSQQIFHAVVHAFSIAFSGSSPLLPGHEYIDNGLSLGEKPHPFVSENQGTYGILPEPRARFQEPDLPEERPLEEKPFVIGQLAHTYILCETPRGLLIVDQHAAHERILYETLSSSMNRSQVEVQGLLIPLELELSPGDRQTALARAEELQALGIHLEHFGGNTFLLTGVPVWLEHVPWERALPELLSELNNTGKPREALIDRMVMLMACHGAIRAGQPLSRQEMDRLLMDLGHKQLPTHCPHGRPIFMEFSHLDMEKMFKRVV